MKNTLIWLLEFMTTPRYVRTFLRAWASYAGKTSGRLTRKEANTSDFRAVNLGN